MPTMPTKEKNLWLRLRFLSTVFALNKTKRMRLSIDDECRVCVYERRYTIPCWHVTHLPLHLPTTAPSRLQFAMWKITTASTTNNEPVADSTRSDEFAWVRSRGRCGVWRAPTLRSRDRRRRFDSPSCRKSNVAKQKKNNVRFDKLHNKHYTQTTQRCKKRTCRCFSSYEQHGHIWETTDCIVRLSLFCKKKTR